MINFVVTKITTFYAPCYKCNESGKIRRTFRNKTYIEDCIVCGGAGRIPHHKREEVALKDAIEEIS